MRYVHEHWLIFQISVELISVQGKCEPYFTRNVPSICDAVFTELDYVYMPNTQTHGQPRVRGFLEYLTNHFPFTGHCYYKAVKALCTYYYSPCGYNGTVHVPRFLCPDMCTKVSNNMCSASWRALYAIAILYDEYESSLGLPPCNNTRALIQSLNLRDDCCFKEVEITGKLVFWLHIQHLNLIKVVHMVSFVLSMEVLLIKAE